MPDAVVREVRALKIRYVQAEKRVLPTGRTGATVDEQPREGDPVSSVQSGGGAEKPTEGDQKRRKRAKDKTNTAMKDRIFADNVSHNAESFIDDLRQLNPIFMDVRRIGGEMIEGSTNSNIRRAATIHEFNLTAAAGQHRLEPHLWIPLEDSRSRR